MHIRWLPMHGGGPPTCGGNAPTPEGETPGDEGVAAMSATARPMPEGRRGMGVQLIVFPETCNLMKALFAHDGIRLRSTHPTRLTTQ